MVSPGLQVQGMIVVPGPALVSIVSLTEGVAAEGPSTHNLHYSHEPVLHDTW